VGKGNCSPTEARGDFDLEIQPALVEAARGRPAWINLGRTRFVEVMPLTYPLIITGTVSFSTVRLAGTASIASSMT
jgi:hypothetical protein